MTQLSEFLQNHISGRPYIRFRAIGSRKTGIGHVMRCSALANVLIKKFPVAFDTDLIEPEVQVKIKNRLDERVKFLSGKDENCDENQIGQLIEIYDGYEFDTDTYALAKKRKNIVIVIEDHPGSYPHCDMLICHGPHAKPEMFDVDQCCRLILGPEYALINPCFFVSRAKPGQQIRRLFIFLGGGDVNQMTTDLITDILNIKSDMMIEAVLPQPDSSEMSKTAFHEDNVTFHDHISQENLAKLMIECDAAVIAGGSTCLETTSIGLPSFLVAVADNQILPCEAMNQKELALYSKNILDKNSTERHRGLMMLEQFLCDSSLRGKLVKNCAVAFRKSGAESVSQSIEKLVTELGQ